MWEKLIVSVWTEAVRCEGKLCVLMQSGWLVPSAGAIIVCYDHKLFLFSAESQENAPVWKSLWRNPACTFTEVVQTQEDICVLFSRNNNQDFFSLFLRNQRDFGCVRPTGHPGHDLPREGGRVFAAGRNEIIVHHAPAIGAELPEPHLPIGSARHHGPGWGHQ